MATHNKAILLSNLYTYRRVEVKHTKPTLVPDTYQLAVVL